MLLSENDTLKDYAPQKARLSHDDDDDDERMYFNMA